MKTVYELKPGVQTTVQLQGEDLVTATTQDCTPIVEFAKAMRSSGNVGTSDMKFAGTIPDVIVEGYCNRVGITFDRFLAEPVHMRRILTDPDYKDFRIWEGRL